MTVQETTLFLQNSFSQLDSRVIDDVDRHGNEFCELILASKAGSLPPIAVQITENGCSVSVAQFENVTGSQNMSAEQTRGAIEDILADKIIFVLAYRDEDDVGFGKPFFQRVFAITGDADDMSEEYEDFLHTIQKPLSSFARHFTSLKGRFVIFNFSGSINQTIKR
jgi:hypothetical protein